MLGFGAVLAAFCSPRLLFVPVNFVIAATGALFGPLLGLFYALAGALLGGGRGASPSAARSGASWIRRIAGRRINAVNRRLERHGLLGHDGAAAAADRAVHRGQPGGRRLGDPARDYLLGSLFGMAPGSS